MLVILLVILALLLIILFVPLRYRAKAVIGRIDLDKLSELSDEGSGDDTDHGLEEAAPNDPKSYVLDKIDCKASFSWLLHLVRGGIGYPENTSFWLKVLFFKILPKSEEKKKRKEEKKRRKEEKKSQAKLEKAMDNAGSYEEVSDQSSKDAGNQESLNDQNKSNNKKSSENKTSDISASNIEASDKKDVSGDLDASDYSDEVNGQNGSEDHADKGSKEHTGSLESDDGNVHKDDSENDHENGYRNDHGNDAAEDDNDSEESEDKEDIDIFTFFDFVEKMADLFEKALDFLEKPGEAVEKAFYTISRAYDKMDLIKDLLDSPTFERAFLRAKKDLYLVLRHIMPGKIDADILLGIGDPASMGKLLAGVSVVNTFNDYDIWLEPDFENKVVEASVNIKGRIALWRLLLSAARVYFNKDIRKVKKRFDRIMKK